MKTFVRVDVAAFACGALFGLGLIVSGMADPANVQGFLDVGGSFRPELALVMGGALAVYLPLYRWVVARKQPLCAATFDVPTRRAIDAPLIGGAVIFGIGWGLWGYCPGPALVAIGAGSLDALIFVGAMVAGMLVFRAWPSRRT